MAKSLHHVQNVVKEKEKRRTPPKVRSWIRNTLVHTPQPKKEVKHPKREFEKELYGT